MARLGTLGPVTSTALRQPLVRAPRLASAAALPFLALGAVVVLWGMGPPLTKLITAPSLSVVFVRLWVAVPLMTGLQLASGSRPSWPSLRASLLGGAAFAVNMVTFFFAIHRSSIATFTVISALQPGLVMLGASRLFGERVTRWGVAWTVVAIGGAGIAVLGAGAEVHTSGLGILFSLLSLGAMTVYFFAAKRARVTMGASDYMAGVMLWSAIFVTPIAILGGGLSGIGALGTADLWWLLVVLIGPGMAGHLLISWAVRFVPVSLSSMTMLGTTVIAIVAAWPIHHEPVTLVQALGGVIALGGVAAVITRSG